MNTIARVVLGSTTLLVVSGGVALGEAPTPGAGPASRLAPIVLRPSVSGAPAVRGPTPLPLPLLPSVPDASTISQAARAGGIPLTTIVQSGRASLALTAGSLHGSSVTANLQFVGADVDWADDTVRFRAGAELLVHTKLAPGFAKVVEIDLIVESVGPHDVLSPSPSPASVAAAQPPSAPTIVPTATVLHIGGPGGSTQPVTLPLVKGPVTIPLVMLVPATSAGQPAQYLTVTVKGAGPWGFRRADIIPIN
jgi:hypothetical protein